MEREKRNILASTVAHLLSHYMVPISISKRHGYRLKSQFNHLLPHTFGRSTDYVLTPYCLPEHDAMFLKAMHEIELMADDQKKYAGCHNQTFM